MFKKKFLLSVSILVLVFAVSIPATATNIDTIDTEELLELVPATSDDRDHYGEVPHDWDLALVDTRREEEFEAGHINGAINLPADGEFLPCPFPGDLDTKMIFYGDNPEEWAEMTKEDGYNNVYIYEAGIESWQAEGDYLTTTPQYVDSLIDEDYISDTNNPPYMIIDTRGFGMYLESHVPTAQSMAHTLFEDKYLDYMPPEKDMEIITYCGGFF